MITFFLPLLVRSVILGLDFGSEFIKVSVVSPDSVQVALNQQSKRLTPSYFAIWNQTSPKNTFDFINDKQSKHWEIEDLDNLSWSFFDSAKSHSRRFPNNGVQGFTSIIKGKNGLTGREIFALMIRKLITTIEDGQYKPESTSLVISVEPSTSIEERIAIAESVKLANVTLKAIIDSSTAVANVYAIEKKALYANSPKNVLFFDMGSESSWAGVYQFVLPMKGAIPEVVELSVVNNASLGAKQMDIKLSEFLMCKFTEKHKNIKIVDPKMKQIFLDEAKRAKEILTTDKYITIRIDDIIDDYGLNYVLTREEFNSLISNMDSSIANLLYKAVEKSGLQLNEIDSIELIGGPTRVPFVYQTLMKASGMTKLNRTLNSDEAVALGAGYVGQRLTSFFKSDKNNKNQVIFKPLCGINVNLYQNDDFVKEIYTESSKIDDISKIDLNRNQIDGVFHIVVNNWTVSSFTFENVEEIQENDVISLMFYFDKASVPSLYSAYLNKNKRINPKIINSNSAMSKEDFQKSTLFINKIDQIAHEREYFQQVKNDYESLVYQVQDNLEYNETFKQAIDNNQFNELTNLIQRQKAMIDDGSINHCSSSQILEQINLVKSQIEKILSKKSQESTWKNFGRRSLNSENNRHRNPKKSILTRFVNKYV
ncbi:dnaK protein [Tritrichomonas foetus]|uniref:DnaK protein n=1 Tax=Tritrichomonas foetus TaxID=1144522 RepID=A0A1J4KQN7_9EUKA|nr:dnaK protein [Tritrichomonas foetus]|eukprot:OHT13615.1 dnaK protein [Tritrichomonas foetus]